MSMHDGHDKRFAADAAPDDGRAERREPRYDLATLVAGMTPQNVHPEVEWGEPRGEEAW